MGMSWRSRARHFGPNSGARTAKLYVSIFLPSLVRSGELPIKGTGAVRLYDLPWCRRLIKDAVIDGASVCGGLRSSCCDWIANLAIPP